MDKMEERRWFRDYHALIFVFDLSKKKTLSCFDEFKTKFTRTAGSGMPIIVIGNKSDLTREVSIEEIAKWREDKAVEVRLYFDVLFFFVIVHKMSVLRFSKIIYCLFKSELL